MEETWMKKHEEKGDISYRAAPNVSAGALDKAPDRGSACVEKG
jgi:hypothetical protein